MSFIRAEVGSLIKYDNYWTQLIGEEGHKVCVAMWALTQVEDEDWDGFCKVNQHV